MDAEDASWFCESFNGTSLNCCDQPLDGRQLITKAGLLEAAPTRVLIATELKAQSISQSVRDGHVESG